MNPGARNIIVYGDSLILEGIRADLSAHPGIRVLLLDATQELPLDTIRTWCPAIFIFDLKAVRPDLQLALLQQPGLLLVGIETETHQALILSSFQQPAHSVEDLLSIIQKEKPRMKNQKTETSKGVKHEKQDVIH
jgi:hypothetical protein